MDRPIAGMGLDLARHRQVIAAVFHPLHVLLGKPGVVLARPDLAEILRTEPVAGGKAAVHRLQHISLFES